MPSDAGAPATHQRCVLVTLAPEDDQLIHRIASLIEVQYQSIEQAVGEQLVTELVSVLAQFIAADSAAVAHVDLSGG